MNRTKVDLPTITSSEVRDRVKEMEAVFRASSEETIVGVTSTEYATFSDPPCSVPTAKRKLKTLADRGLYKMVRVRRKRTDGGWCPVWGYVKVESEV